MKKNLLIIAEIMLGAVVLAVITNKIAEGIKVPLWASVLIGVVALGGLVAAMLYRRKLPEGQPPPPVTLMPPTPAATSESGPAVVGVGQIEGGVAGTGGMAMRDVYIQMPPLPKPSTPPFQVPRDISYFVDRKESMVTLESALTSEEVAAVCGVTGMAGIGKSALAAHFASVRRELFPDGVLYASLRDSDPLTVLASLAAAYGVDVSAYSDVPTRAAAVRSVLAGKHVLVILDNAEEIVSLRAILPCCGDRCAVLVTTRDVQLAAAVVTGEVLRLEELSAEGSLVLLEKLAGVERVQADVAATREIGTLLGHLPLAVEIAGKLASLRDWGMGELSERLQDGQERLGDLKVKDLEVRTSFELSYELLGEGQRALFALLGAFQGLSFDGAAARAVTGVEEIGEKLLSLCDLSLLWPEAGGRFRQHLLLSDFSREKLRESGREQGVLEKRARYYLDLAKRENDRLEHAGTIVEARRVLDAELAQMQAGRSWAMESGEDEVVADYALALRRHFDLAGLYRKAVEWDKAGLDVAWRLGRKEGVGQFLIHLGSAYVILGDVNKAIDCYEQALAVVHEIGDQQSEGVALGNLGNAYSALGEVRRAIDCYQQALQIAREIGDRQGEGADLGNLGIAYAKLGKVRKAIKYHEQALAIAREVGNRRGEGTALGNLGLAYASLGRISLGAMWKAIAYYKQALEIAREIGDRKGEGARLGNLGLAYWHLGEDTQAIVYYEQALMISRKIGDRRDEGVWLGNLGLVHADSGEEEKAKEYFNVALAIAEETGDAIALVNHLWNLSQLYVGRGKLADALALVERCVEIEERLDLPNVEESRQQMEELRAKVEGREPAAREAG